MNYSVLDTFDAAEAGALTCSPCAFRDSDECGHHATQGRSIFGHLAYEGRPVPPAPDWCPMTSVATEPVPADIIEADRIGARFGAVVTGTCRRCFGALFFDPAAPAEPLCSCESP